MRKLAGSLLFFSGVFASTYGYDALSKHLSFKENLFLTAKQSEKFKQKNHPFPDSCKRTVCIVGAGVVGVASAYTLLTEGCNVILVEKHSQAATQTSFQNGCILINTTFYPLVSWVLLLY
jgi:heterodisulfide reductase subunit A-like polyferredoxin